MGTVKLATLIAAATLTFHAVALHATSSDAPIVSNGSFETKDPKKDRPASWHHNARSSREIVDVIWDEEIAHSGQRSISIGYPAENLPEGDVIFFWTTKIYGLEVGASYELTAWIRTRELGHTPAILVNFMDGSDEFMSRADTHVEYPITGTTDWTPVKSTFRVPENTSHVKIRAALSSLNNAGGRVWFDDIAIAKVGE